MPWERDSAISLKATAGTRQVSRVAIDLAAVVSDRDTARGVYSVPTGHTDHDILYAVAWLSSAAASGLIGNVTYAAVQRLLRGRTEPPNGKSDICAAGQQVGDPVVGGIWHVMIEGPGIRAEVLVQTEGLLYGTMPIVVWLP